MVSVKTNDEIERMRAAGCILSGVLKVMAQMAKPGMSTKEMNQEAQRLILSAGAKPSFMGYNGFKFATCMSVDDVVVHGFPSERKLKEGEILGVDIGVYLNGFHADAARTFAIGEVSPQKQRLIETAEQCFWQGIKHALPGKRLGDMSAAIQAAAERNGFSVVRTMTGHGIGKRLHEDPSIPNYGTAGTGLALKPGYALAIEPMINAGGYEVFIDNTDGWTCRTTDGSASAHYENTLIITDGEPEILTL